MTKVDDWYAESQLGMRGWDFKHLDGRWETTPLPWRYRDLVQENLNSNDDWLDVDTGGGELMASFHHAAAKTTVTEGWAPNITLLREKFAGSALQVIADPDETLAAVPNDSFDIITNSHGALPVAETITKLRVGGRFVTQQVGASNNFSLSRFLNPTYTPAFPNNTLINRSVQLQTAGMTIQRQAAAFSELRFFDVGAIVYYVSVIPWEFPNFSVAACLPQLRQLDRLMTINGAVTTFEDRFMIVARKE